MLPFCSCGPVKSHHTTGHKIIYFNTFIFTTFSQNSFCCSVCLCCKPFCFLRTFFVGHFGHRNAVFFWERATCHKVHNSVVMFYLVGSILPLSNGCPFFCSLAFFCCYHIQFSLTLILHKLAHWACDGDEADNKMAVVDMNKHHCFIAIKNILLVFYGSKTMM